MRTTRVSRLIRAPRDAVYRALVDARAVSRWKAPDGMTCQVHEFDARVGGAIRVGLSYDEPTSTGKTTTRTDTYHGRFTKLVVNEQVVEIDEFETSDPAMQGEMTITISLRDANGGTEVFGVHEGLPSGVSITDNEAGWRMALAKLAAFVEADQYHQGVLPSERSRGSHTYAIPCDQVNGLAFVEWPLYFAEF
jgi:uncharacterized protein YndB with AHSA1/START domain